MDYNGDGRLDILTGSISGKIHLFKKKPNGTYAAGETLKKEVSTLLRGLGPSLNVGSSSAACMADWNGDGKLDLFIGTGEGEVYWLPNEGTREKPAFSKTERLKVGSKPVLAETRVAGPFVADWDGDGLPDLLVGCGSGAVVWHRNTGTRTQPQLAAGVKLVESLPAGWDKDPAVFKNPKRSAGNAKVCVADWNGDGRQDLIVGDSSYERQGRTYKSHGWVWVYLRKGGGAEAGM